MPKMFVLIQLSDGSILHNLITDVAGVRVGHAHDHKLASGVTAILFDKPAVASIDVRGGGPGIRDGALLEPVNTVEIGRAHV